MAGPVKFNKTALKAQRDSLRKYQSFLPILILKKMQLQLVLRQLEPVIETRQRELIEALDKLKPHAALLGDPTVDIEDLLQIEELRLQWDNVAGVATPEFEDVVFLVKPYPLFSTPGWLDIMLEALKRMISIREELKVLRQKEAILREELRTTTQRVNLFEKRLIPELKENIRRIKIFLGDQETASVGWAKMAKSKLTVREATKS
jgi:V/A-type H+-transporting ATPase subunit D